jgi:hypothetical protein
MSDWTWEYVPDTPSIVGGLTQAQVYGEGPVMIWFLEDYRDDVVLVVRAQHFGSPDPAG